MHDLTVGIVLAALGLLGTVGWTAALVRALAPPPPAPATAAAAADDELLTCSNPSSPPSARTPAP